MDNFNATGILGFGKDNEAEEFRPNRAQRRALERRLKRQQRKGQQAWERQQRNSQPQVEGEGS